MNTEEIELLKRILNELESTTEQYIDHAKMVDDSEKYLLIIAISKYLERHG